MSNSHNPLGKLIDMVKGVKGAPCDDDDGSSKSSQYDHKGRREHLHDHPHKPQHEHHCDNDRKITVNVNVGYGGGGSCPPSTGTGTGTTTPPGRPIHTTGISDGTITGGLGAPTAITQVTTRGPNVWPGPRSKLFLPFLFIRATAGDTGARPIQGSFWESPDILIMPNITPAAAPARPPDLGGFARAGVPNTLYAHVWNLGQAPAWGCLVEFYWFNPTLGFSGDQAHLIGKTYTDLGPRGGPKSHRLVKCPLAWNASFLNGGHECLVVRISQPCSDPLSNPRWDASQNRHIGQRNIHVMSAAEAAAKPTLGVNIGPLFGQPANVVVKRAETTTMPWLHLVTNSRTVLPRTAAANGDVGITAATNMGADLPKLGAVVDPRAVGLIGNETGVVGDGKQVGFVATDGDPGQGGAHVYRVSGAQNGTTFGGYTVVVLGSRG